MPRIPRLLRRKTPEPRADQQVLSIRTQGKLDPLNEEHEYLFASMAHQLKAPLSVIRGFSELLSIRADQMGMDEIRLRLEKIQRSADEMATIIDRGLHFMKQEAGGWVYELCIINNVNAVVFRICTDLQSRYPTLCFDCRVPSIFGANGDPEALAVMVQHLVDNAEKYGKGGAPITVTTTRENGDICISVINEDDEHTPELDDDIFLPFATADHDEGPGSGLGLYTVAMLARSMLGTANFVQERGITCFKICLPQASVIQIDQVNRIKQEERNYVEQREHRQRERSRTGSEENLSR